MDLLGFGLGAALLLIIGLVVYVAKHPPQAAGTNTKDLANTLAAAGTTTWDALKADLPEIISAELADARKALSAALADAAAAKAQFATQTATWEAHIKMLEAQVGQFLHAPPSALLAPAVAAAHAEDTAAVKAATVALSPAS